MKDLTIYFVLCGVLVVALASNADNVKFCSWITDSVSSLEPPKNNEFCCLNGQRCFSRSSYCNGINGCNDRSDEIYCRVHDCPVNFITCSMNYPEGSHKCIPQDWRCDNYSDCPYGEDETNCRGGSQTEPSRTEVNKVKQWVVARKNEVSSPGKWGSDVDQLAMILYLATHNFSISQPNETEMAYELNIRLLSRLSSMKLKNIPSTELASYVHAFLVMCIHPRKFYGYDIIQELRDRVDQEKYPNPYVLLALCNAGETITESDTKKLIDTFWSKKRTFWTGMQAAVVMALACANKQPGNEVDSETLGEMTLELKQLQYRNGTVVNLPTTALVMQALISIDSELDPDNFDEKKAYQELLRNQKSDGSFGDVMSTFFVTPVLSCKSLVDINSDHCQYGSADEMSALENLSRRDGPKIRVQYSLWIGKEKDMERNLVLRVPQNISLYSVMETAAEIDSRFKFEYSVKSRKPYINAISGMRDNPLSGKFWFLYVVESEQTTLSKESPADIIPKDNDHYVMWYKRVTWVE